MKPGDHGTVTDVMVDLHGAEVMDSGLLTTNYDMSQYMGPM